MRPRGRVTPYRMLGTRRPRLVWPDDKWQRRSKSPWAQPAPRTNRAEPATCRTIRHRNAGSRPASAVIPNSNRTDGVSRSARSQLSVSAWRNRSLQRYYISRLLLDLSGARLAHPVAGLIHRKFEISHSSTVIAGNYIAEGWRFMANFADKVLCIEAGARTMRMRTRTGVIIKTAA